MSEILPLAVNAPEQEPDEPSFWVPDPNEPVDDDLETLYWRHIDIDDIDATRAALGRIAAAVLAWSAEVASWGVNEPPLWCPSCGEYSGGEPCATPSCAQRPPMPCCNPVAETCCSGLPKDYVFDEVES
jgi:hypothetical protein